MKLKRLWHWAAALALAAATLLMILRCGDKVVNLEGKKVDFSKAEKEIQQEREEAEKARIEKLEAEQAAEKARRKAEQAAQEEAERKARLKREQDAAAEAAAERLRRSLEKQDGWTRAIQTMEEELAEHRDTKARGEREASESKKRIAECAKQVADTEAQLDFISKQLEICEPKERRVADELKELGRQQDDINAEIDALRFKTSVAARDQRNDYEGKLVEINAKRNTVIAEWNLIKDKTDPLRARSTMARGVLVKAKKELADAQARFEQAREAAKRAEEGIRSTQARLEEAQANPP